MDEHRPRRLQIWLPLLFSIILIAGMVLGFNLRDTLRSKRDISSIVERNDRLEQIIDLIKEKYVDSINTNLLYEDAVSGIVSHLDPHTVYIPISEVEGVNEDLEGSFFGIGVEFSIVRDTIQVTSVVEQGPSERVGVEAGDQLIKVGDSVIAGTGITTDRIIRLLRGKQYSKVVVTMRSPFTGKLKNVIIERDAVPLYSVEANLMLDSTTGYIKINRFAATTFEEFLESLKSLKKKGAKEMILDLRQNPGGYLDAATMIADEFIDGDKLLVYTVGSKAPKREYRAGMKGIFEKGKLAILVDEGSASASEILAGAIQDWDRGIVVGRRTFGKGLVQEQYEMDNGSALRLTIARYYTPSGRSIQRTYKRGKIAYEAEITERIEQETASGKDSVVAADTMTYYTSQKRKVYAGGGITPDVYVPIDTGKMNSGLLNTLYSESLKNTLWDYFIRHKDALKRYPSINAFRAGFNAQDVIDYYLKNLPAPTKNATEKLLQKNGNRQFFTTQIKAQLARLLFRNNGYYAIIAPEDKTLQTAVRVLHSNDYYSIISR